MKSLNKKSSKRSATECWTQGLVLAALAIGVIISPAAFSAEESRPEAPVAKQNQGLLEDRYYDEATVLLIDPVEGHLGIEMPDPNGGAETKKYSFRVNVQEVDVTNPMNQELQFSDIQVGDSVDLSVHVSPDGQETVYEIWDYNRVSQEE